MQTINEGTPSQRRDAINLSNMKRLLALEAIAEKMDLTLRVERRAPKDAKNRVAERVWMVSLVDKRPSTATQFHHHANYHSVVTDGVETELCEGHRNLTQVIEEALREGARLIFDFVDEPRPPREWVEERLNDAMRGR